jgi:hypothetical protein
VFICLLCIVVKMGDNGDSSAAASATATATTDLGSDTTSSTETIAPTITSTSQLATTEGGITTPTALPNAGESTCLFPGGIAVPIQNASSGQTTGCSLGFLCKSGSECRFWGWNIQFTG